MWCELPAYTSPNELGDFGSLDPRVLAETVQWESQPLPLVEEDFLMSSENIAIYEPEELSPTLDEGLLISTNSISTTPSEDVKERIVYGDDSNQHMTKIALSAVDKFQCNYPGCTDKKTGKPNNFKHKSHLKRHQETIHRNVHGPPMHRCWVPMCDKRYKRKDALQAHLKNHSKKGGKSRYVATLDKDSQYYDPDWKGELDERENPIPLPNVNHVNSPMKVLGSEPALGSGRSRKYPCPDCSLSCYRKVDLERHVLIHTGTRPYICSFEGWGHDKVQCLLGDGKDQGKFYSNPTSLRMHMNRKHKAT
ncbi:uncharacterized protein PV07_10504 [Cladophialophora immunda]|uniref:C2H2-type domain-containing protein n=1 Tax=Cladophialophora immunda TaxID=569365 RepID=A0A0D2CMM0_9EURO|nr:uncharacterized protein PV07_10504 [Cladophialophora immunda]KIW24814.1 hypothetical protein PV07_10504 [Cladophialophora immunda]